MPSSSGVVLTRNSNSSKIGGLQLSSDPRGIQKTQRSSRGLGGNGSNHQQLKKPSLGADLARIDSKKGSGSTRPKIVDDLSIDDTFVSTAEAPKKSAIDNFFSSKSTRRREPSSQKKDAKLKRLPPRRSTFAGATARREMDDLSKSDQDNLPQERTQRRDSWSRSDHVARFTTSNQQRLNSSKNGATAPPVLDDLSPPLEHNNRLQGKMGRRDSLSKSDHVPQSAASKLRTLNSIHSSQNGATAPPVLDDLSPLEHNNRLQGKMGRRDSLSKSDHVPQSAASKLRTLNSIHSSQNGATAPPVLDDLSPLEHNNHLQGKMGRMDSLSKSDHVGRFTTSTQRRRNSINSNTPRNKQPSIQGIYNIIDSMDSSSANLTTETVTTATDTTATTASGPNNTSHRLPRRSKTIDSSTSPVSSASPGNSQHGINVLVDQNGSNGSPKDQKDSSPKEAAKDSSPKDQKDSSPKEAAKEGIYKFIGSMSTNTTISTSLSPLVKERDIKNNTPGRKPPDGSTRRLQVHQETLSRLSSEKEDEDEVLDRRKVRQARRDSRSKLLAESTNPAPEAVESTVKEQDDRITEAHGGEDEEEEEDQCNDYDTVATPKTVSEPPPPMKDAPPPPQRKNMARRPRNKLPQFAPQKPATDTVKSAPTQMQVEVPATPMRSPGGFVFDLQNTNDPTSTPVVINTPQQRYNTPNQVTPQAVSMPVMPNNDFDGVATPCSVAKPTAPPLAEGPPPPPKRNMDVGSRWKSRQTNKLPTKPGQNGNNNVMATPNNAPKAPVMSSISPGGIVIEVNAPTGGRRKMIASEPMTPSSLSAGRDVVTPGGYQNTPGSHCNTTPGGRQFRGLPEPQTPGIRVRRRSDISDVSNESYMRTPSSASQAMSDISELTYGTHAGSFYGTTPTRETPRRSQVEGAPQTPSLYTSPGGDISELTPGGYSVGLYGDDDYKSSIDRRERRHTGSSSARVMSSPSLRDGFAKSQLLTPGTCGILLEETDDDGEAVVPSTPSLQSPAGVVSQLTPGSYGINILDEDDNDGGDNRITA